MLQFCFLKIATEISLKLAFVHYLVTLKTNLDFFIVINSCLVVDSGVVDITLPA